MADTTEFTGTQQNTRGTGLIPQAGQFLSNVQKLTNQPSVKRSLPAVVAVIVLVLGLFCLFNSPTTRKNNSLCIITGCRKIKSSRCIKKHGCRRYS